MITNTGKNLIGKYLVGKSTQYASHIAIGCGPEPLALSTAYGDYSAKTELDFEMTRIPIISRAYINDKSVATITSVTVTNGSQNVSFVAPNNFVVGQTVAVKDNLNAIGGLYPINYNAYTIISATSTTFVAKGSNTYSATTTYSSAVGTATGYLDKISFTAELPLEDRYEITELGLYSDQSNPNPSGLDNKNIFNFSKTAEPWKIGTTTSSIDSTSDIVYITNTLTSTDITDNKAVLTNTDNTFFGTARTSSFERPRFLNDALIISGALSKFAIASSTTTLRTIDTAYGDTYLTISNINLGNLDINSTTDELRLAYSLIDLGGSYPPTNSTLPQSVNIMIEFYTKTGVKAQYHFKQASTAITATSTPALSVTDKYNVLTLKLSDASGYTYQGSGFSFNDVTTARIYASAQASTDTNPLSSWAICLDGLNFVNKDTTNNSNYGLVAYVPIRNSTSTSIVKASNTTSLIEFRLTLGILGS